MSKSDFYKYFAELVGTFVLVFIGCGSAAIAGKHIGFTGISLAFGFSVLAMVYAIGKISGCHINPAVSVGMLVSGKMKWQDTVMYVIFQCIGAIIAAAILLAIARGLPGYTVATGGLGQNGFGAHSPGGYSMTACLIAERLIVSNFSTSVFSTPYSRQYSGNLSSL